MMTWLLRFPLALMLLIMSVKNVYGVGTLMNVPPAYYWGGFSSSTSGQFLCAAQSDVSSSTAGDGQIYYSLDSGSTWSVSNAPAGAYESLAGSESGQWVVASSFSGIFVSSDYGVTFAQKFSAMGISFVSTNPSGSTMVGVVSGLSSSGCVVLSTNFGSSWSSGLGPASTTCLAVAVDSTGNNIVVMVKFGGLYTSNNAGVDWTQSYSAETSVPQNLGLAAGGSYFYCGIGSPSSLIVSWDGGANWATLMASGITSTTYYTYLSVDSTGMNILLNADGNLWFSTNGGNTFTAPVTTSASGQFFALGANSAMNSAANVSMWTAQYEFGIQPEFLYTLNPSVAATPTASPTSQPSESTNPSFPTNPSYAIGKLFTDSDCRQLTAVKTEVVNVCLNVGSVFAPSYVRVTCGNNAVTNTYYSDSACSVVTGEVMTFPLKQCEANAYTTDDTDDGKYDEYIMSAACGVSDPFAYFPDGMVAETFYIAGNDCQSQVISVWGYADDTCLVDSPTLSGKFDWSTLVAYEYSTNNCQGSASARILSTSCVSTTFAGFSAQSTWQQITTSSNSVSALSAGGIAGVTIGAVVVIGFAAVGAYFAFLRKPPQPLGKQEVSASGSADISIGVVPSSLSAL